MRAARTAVAGLVAGCLALSLVAAETAPATDAVGSASTRLLGATARVTGPLDTPVANLLDVTTSATTDGTPFAVTSVVPIQVGDEQVGATGASSDGQTEASSPGGSLGAAGDALGLSVSPIETTATATADRALATVGAATGQLSALLGQLGLDLDTAGVTSLVTGEESSATQGMTVSGLDLSLGDLGLDADLLGSLGLDTILGLLEQLPVDVPSDLADVSGLLGDIEELEGALGALDASELLGTVGEIQDLTGVLAEVDALLADQVAVEDLRDVDNLTDLLAALGGVDLTASSCALPDTDGLVLDLAGVLADLTGTVDCIAAEVSSTLADVGVADRAGLLGAIDALEGLLPGELDGLLAQLDTITGLLEDILAKVGDLDDLLALLPDLLGEAEGLSLLDVGAFDLGTSAIAGDSLDTSSATVLCDASDVSVLGRVIPTPDCSDALSGLSDVSDVVNGAFGQLSGVLNTLPLTDVVQAGELRAEMFTDLVEEVTEVDGVITSTAGFNLLDLEVPSLTIDASQVTDALGGLGLPDVAGPVEDLLGELTAVEGVLDGLGLGEQLDAIAAADPTGTAGQITTLIDGLAVGDLGSLAENVSTPGLELLIDPVATASFAAGASGGTGDPGPTAPAPAPAPTGGEEPSLPTTGGGLALVGILAMAGGVGLRRRR